MLAGLMRDHLAGGGMILAATHGPIGLDGAKELRLGGRMIATFDRRRDMNSPPQWRSCSLPP